MAPRLTTRSRARLGVASLLTATAVGALTVTPSHAFAAHVTPALAHRVAAAPARRLAGPVLHLRRLAPPPVATHAAAPAPRPAAAPAARPAVAPRDLLVSADGTLDTGVTTYSDCSGRTPLTHAAAAIDTCIGGRTFFVGHNPGVFTPLMHMSPGAMLTWYDWHGVAHHLRVVAVRVWQHAGMPPAPLDGATVQFQTCITWDGSVDRLLDAVEV